MKPHVGIIDRAFVDSGDAKLEVDRINRSHEGDSVANLQTVALGSVLADDARVSSTFPFLQLVSRDFGLAKELQKLLRIDGKLGKTETVIVFELSSEEGEGRNGGDPGIREMTESCRAGRGCGKSCCARRCAMRR